MGNKPSGLARENQKPATEKSMPLSDIPIFDNVESRVDYIVDLMSELRWERGKTGKILAKAWNLALSTVEGYSAEASRLVTADRDTAAREISLICKNMMAAAYRAGKAKDAAIVGKLWADVSGANAPTKQAIAIDVEPSKERARKLMAGVFAGGVGKESDVETAPATELETDDSADNADEP